MNIYLPPLFLSLHYFVNKMLLISLLFPFFLTYMRENIWKTTRKFFGGKTETELYFHKNTLLKFICQRTHALNRIIIFPYFHQQTGSPLPVALLSHPPPSPSFFVLRYISTPLATPFLNPYPSIDSPFPLPAKVFFFVNFFNV